MSSENVETSECEANYNQTLISIARQNTEIICPEWSKWNFEDCNTKCGFAHVEGTRKCLKGGIELLSTEECENEYPLDSRNQTSQFCADLKPCKWFEWVKDGECSEPCGTGLQSFKRTCNGTRCEGNHWKQEPCNTQYCELSEWEKLGECSETCGGGKLKYKRHCLGNKCDPKEEMFKEEDIVFRN